NEPTATPGGPEQLARQLAGHGSIRQWLLVMGKLGPRKRQVDAVRVLRHLLDSGHHGLGLLLAGDCEPDYEPLMQAAIRDCRAQDRVLMLGNVQDVPALLALRPVCLLTSLREALPGSVIEALGSGRPCFMYPCEGAEDIFGPHLEHFVSAGFQPALLAEKMHALLSDPPRLESETAALQARARSLFSQEAHLATCLATFGLDPRPASGA
ncbi:MAG TPA: glycosyltransferase family 4 protein, partial [Prosthecobacter sp.]|nr:glycosyltransferase family 4 protein [Prosthecobacter sp.]